LTGRLKHGCVQVYTGSGKGKTTAALGLALRAAGAGLRVYFAQFAKAKQCSEHVALERFSDLITVLQCGNHGFMKGEPTQDDRQRALEGLCETRKALSSGDYDVVIIDEGCLAVKFGLFPVDRLLKLIEAKPSGVELVITGRGAPPELIERADLVTEMTEVKHYYNGGLEAREGIEK
jgi:cob(I)alamin adenosyltransferase